MERERKGREKQKDVRDNRPVTQAGIATHTHTRTYDQGWIRKLGLF